MDDNIQGQSAPTKNDTQSSYSYYCEICGKGYVKLGSLQLHIVLKHERNNSTKTTLKEEFACHLCDKVFNDKSNRRRHIKTIHEGHPHPKWKPRPKKKT